MALIDLTVPPGYMTPAPALIFKPEPKEQANMATPKKPDARPYSHGDSQRVREYIEKLPKDKLAGMTGKEYMLATGHKLKSPAIFYTEKKKLLDGNYARAKSKRIPTGRGLPAPAPGIRFTALAEIPLDKFKGSHAEVKAVVLSLVKSLHPRGSEAKVVILADPPAMEVRVPF